MITPPVREGPEEGYQPQEHRGQAIVEGQRSQAGKAPRFKGQAQAQKGPTEAPDLGPGCNVRLLSVFGRSLFRQIWRARREADHQRSPFLQSARTNRRSALAMGAVQ